MSGCYHRLQRARDANVFMINARHAQGPWVVIVEPDADVNLLVVVTVYEVSE